MDKPIVVHRPDLVLVLRGLKAHMGELVQLDPWLPVPQCGCTFSFGEHESPLPIGALQRLIEQVPHFTAQCIMCHGSLMPFVFGGLERGGGIKACCLECSRIFYMPVGGAEAVARLVGPALEGTPFAIARFHDHQAIFGDRRPLWRALRSLGVTDLPDEAWTERREALEPWPLIRLPGGPAGEDEDDAVTASAERKGPYAPVKPLHGLKTELTADNELVYGDRSKFPYLVIRLMPSVYLNEPIHIGPTPPASRKPGSIVIVHQDPWVDGKLRPEVEQELIDKVQEYCKSSRHRMVIVFAPDRQLYVELDGKNHWTTDGIPRTFLHPDDKKKVN